MKKLFLAVLVGLSGSAFAQASYAENQDYLPLAKEIESVKQPTVQEFFWFGCPHCNAVYPAFKKWIDGAPKNILIEKIPAILSGWDIAGQLYYTAMDLNLNIPDQFIYDTIHKKGNRSIIASAKSAKEFLVSQGADKEAVEKSWNSFAVKQKLARAKRLFEEANLNGVPSFIVNGKYNVPVQANFQKTFQVIESVALSTFNDQKNNNEK